MGESAEGTVVVATGGGARSSVWRTGCFWPRDQRGDVGDRWPATEMVRRHAAAGSGRGGARRHQRRLGWWRTGTRAGGLATGRAARDRCPGRVHPRRYPEAQRVDLFGAALDRHFVL